MRASASSAADAEFAIAREAFSRIIDTVVESLTGDESITFDQDARQQLQRAAEQELTTIMSMANEVAQQYSHMETVMPKHLRTAIVLYQRGYNAIPEDEVEQIIKQFEHLSY